MFTFAGVRPLGPAFMEIERSDTDEMNGTDGVSLVFSSRRVPFAHSG